MRTKQSGLAIAGAVAVASAMLANQSAFAESQPGSPSSSVPTVTVPGQPSPELSGFLRPDLSADEKSALSAVMTEHGKYVGTVLGDKNLSVEEKLAKIAEAQKTAAAKIEAFVDPAKLEEFRATNAKKSAEALESIKKMLTGGYAPLPPAMPAPNPVPPSPTPDYWQQRKVEMQKRSTEMRMKRVAEMKAAGMDVSAFTPELLDGTKTEESAFWEVAKKVQTAHEVKMRRAQVERLKSQGFDVSPITEDVLNGDAQTFWNAMKKITESGRPNAPMPDPSGEIREFLRAGLSEGELATLKSAIAENAKAIGAVLGGKTLSVEEKLRRVEARQRAFSEFVESYVDVARLADFRTKSEKKLAQSLEYLKKFLTDGKIQPQPVPPLPEGREGNPARERRKNPGAEGRSDTGNRAEVLSPKLRKALEAKLRQIPEEKKVATYGRVKAAVDSQIEKANANGNGKLVAKLKAIMAIVEEAIGPDEDENLIDTLFQ